MNNNHYQLLKYCVDNRNIKLWNEIKKECDEYGIIIDLEDANLKGTDLENANLKFINLKNTNLEDVNLKYADLKNADLRYTNLKNANLRYVDLSYTICNVIKITGLKWEVIITINQIQIACQIHSPEQWEKFNDEEINKMNTNALDFWKENKENIFSMYKNFEKLNKTKKKDVKNYEYNR